MRPVSARLPLVKDGSMHLTSWVKARKPPSLFGWRAALLPRSKSPGASSAKASGAAFALLWLGCRGVPLPISSADLLSSRDFRAAPLSPLLFGILFFLSCRFHASPSPRQKRTHSITLSSPGRVPSRICPFSPCARTRQNALRAANPLSPSLP